MRRREALKYTSLFTGAALSAGTISAIVTGCKADPALDWSPEALSAQQAILVSEIAERIIPKTDTPGAKDAMISRFIDSAIATNFSEVEKANFLDGLELFQTISQDKFDKSFVELSPQNMDEVMTAVVADSKDKKDHIWPAIKGLTLTGFFNSEIGLTEFLKYDPVPGEWKGCIDYAEVGAMWSLG